MKCSSYRYDIRNTPHSLSMVSIIIDAQKAFDYIVPLVLKFLPLDEVYCLG